MTPVKDSVPKPILRKLPNPAITPEKVVEVPSPPETRRRVFAKLMVPAPAIDPTVSLEETLYEAPLETFTAVLSDKYPVTSNVPEVTLVDPVALFVPDKVNTPEPDFVK